MNSFFNKVGIFLKKYIYTTIISFITFVMSCVSLGILSIVSRVFGEDSVIAKVLGWIFSAALPFVYLGVFALLLIYISKMPKDDVAREAREDFENGYPGLIKDIKNILKREWITFLALSAEIMLQWYLWAYCFHSVAYIVFIPFDPVYIFSKGLLQILYFDWLYGMLTYILCAVFIFAVYVSELALMRKKWYKRNFNERIEK